MKEVIPNITNTSPEITIGSEIPFNLREKYNAIMSIIATKHPMARIMYMRAKP